MMRFMTVLCALLLWMGSASASSSGGYFLVFPLQQGTVQAPTVMAVDEYVASPALEADARDWQLRLLDAAGAELFSTDLRDPTRMQRSAHGDIGDPILIARVPALAAASQLQLVDADGHVLWQQALDQAFRSAARAQGEQSAREVRSHIAAPAREAAEIRGSTQKDASPQADVAQQQRQARIRSALDARGESASPAERTAAEKYLRDLQQRESEQRKPPAKSRTRQHDELSVRPAPGSPSAAPGLRALRGTVKTQEGTAIADISVRVRNTNGSYVISSVTDEDGSYELFVAPGDYKVNVDSGAREGLSADNYLYVRSAPVTVQVPATGDVRQDLQLDKPLRTLTVFVRWDEWVQSTAEVRVEQNGETLARPRLGLWDDAACVGAMCSATWTVRMTPGTYDLTLELPTGGLATVTQLNVDLRSADQRVEFNARSPAPAWTGRVLDAEGAPLANTEVVAYDGLGRYRSWDMTDANGRVGGVAMAPGWTLEFHAPWTGDLARKRITVADPAQMPASVKLDKLTFQSSTSTTLRRIYTGSASQRIKMVYIGDGYTTLRETFTDRNSNGVWDGVLWYDLDRNGQYDEGTDIAAVYGNATPPVNGSTDPGANNEPFNDRNNDGYPSLNDEAVLNENARSHLRALFGADYFERQRHMFQADVAFVASEQAGMTVTDTDGNVIKRANTYFGANMSTERSIIELDRLKAALLAETLVPGFHEVVVMVNQPIPAGRATQTIGGPPAVMVTNGGPLVNDPNDATPAHEMGHFIGDLWDEYSEHFRSDDGTETYDGANVSNSIELTRIPWRNWLSPERPRPDLVPREGLGVFEGAHYVQGGAYRPDWNSIMRYGILFNAPSVRKLDARMAQFGPVFPQNPPSGNWYDRSHSGHGFDFQLLKHDAVNGDEYYLVFYTYDSRGVGDWFTALGNYRNGRFIARADANGNTLSHIRYDASKPAGQRIVLDGSINGSVGIDFSNPPQCLSGRETASQLGLVSWKIGTDSANWCIEPVVAPSRISQPDLSGHWYSAGDGGWGFEAMSLTAANGATELIVYLYYPDADGKPRWATASSQDYTPGATLTLSEVANGYCRTCPSKPLTLEPVGTMILSLSNDAPSQVSILVGNGFSRTAAPVMRLSLPPEN